MERKQLRDKEQAAPDGAGIDVGKVIRIDEERVKDHLSEMVRDTVKAAQIILDGAEETMAYYSFPREHWRKIRTNNPMERLMREIRRRTRVVGAFPDGNSALMLVSARLRHVASGKLGCVRYMDMARLYGPDALGQQVAG